MFCGRDDLIDTMHAELKGSAPSEVDGKARKMMAQKVVVLHGLGGMGKTSIALEYAFRYSKLYTAVFWADVTSEMSFFQSARGLAEHMIASYSKRGFSIDQIATTLGLRDLLDLNGQLTSDETAGRRVTEAVKGWLAEDENEGWLLVLDNYGDVDAVDIRLLLPTCDAGHAPKLAKKNF
jgi:signal recognition particle GTPase